MTGGEIGLPPLLDHKDFATLGEWLDCLYVQYRAIVHDAGIRLWGKPILPRGDVCADGRDKKFWHIITCDAGRRTADRRRRLSTERAAVLGQAWHLLELLAAGDMRAVWWREPWRSGLSAGRVFVTTVDVRLVVVLEEARGHFGLVTVYPVGRRARSKTFNRAAAAWESGACVLPAVKRRSLPGPYHSPDAIERHRTWM